MVHSRRRQGKLPPCFGCDNPLQTPLAVNNKNVFHGEQNLQSHQAVKVHETEEFFASLTLLSKSEWWPWLVLGSTLGLCSRPWYTEPCPNRERPPPGCAKRQSATAGPLDFLVAIPCLSRKVGSVSVPRAVPDRPAPGPSRRSPAAPTYAHCAQHPQLSNIL